MKQYIAIALGIVCAVLAIILFMTKRDDAAQHTSDTEAITDFSNQLNSAVAQITVNNGSILTLSNSLNDCQSQVLTFSNNLTAAEASIAADLEQITNLNQQVTVEEAQNQTLGKSVVDLTNQVTKLTGQLAATQTSLTETNQDLAQAYKEYGLLEERFRQNVAERVIMARKFYNVPSLQAQLEQLKENPAAVISAEDIYNGLDVQVNADGKFRPLSKD